MVKSPILHHRCCLELPTWGDNKTRQSIGQFYYCFLHSLQTMHLLIICIWDEMRLVSPGNAIGLNFILRVKILQIPV